MRIYQRILENIAEFDETVKLVWYDSYIDIHKTHEKVMVTMANQTEKFPEGKKFVDVPMFYMGDDGEWKLTAVNKGVPAV